METFIGALGRIHAIERVVDKSCEDSEAHRIIKHFRSPGVWDMPGQLYSPSPPALRTKLSIRQAA